MTPAAFAQTMLAEAERASAATGVDVVVILAQWADETDWGTSVEFVDHHNVAGISPGGVLASYSSVDLSVDAYIATMLSGYYVAVRRPGLPIAQAVALGQSPWAASHYDNGAGPGSAVVAIIDDDFAELFPAPPPPAPQPPALEENETVPYILRDPVTGAAFLVDMPAGKAPTHIDTEENLNALVAAGVKEIPLSGAFIATLAS